MIFGLGSIRSQRIDLAYHQRRCSRLFGEGITSAPAPASIYVVLPGVGSFPPASQRTNVFFGGINIAATHITFTVRRPMLLLVIILIPMTRMLSTTHDDAEWWRGSMAMGWNTTR